jgi:hypothetical protein
MAMKYEYTIQMSDSQHLEALVNQYGSDGWRVASIHFQPHPEQTTVLFERQSVEM